MTPRWLAQLRAAWKRKRVLEKAREDLAKGDMTPAERRRFRRQWLAVAEQDEKREQADRLI